jgi:hypothetical protein
MALANSTSLAVSAAQLSDLFLSHPTNAFLDTILVKNYFEELSGPFLN